MPALRTAVRKYKRKRKPIRRNAVMVKYKKPIVNTNRGLYRIKRHSYLANAMFGVTLGGGNGEAVINTTDSLTLSTGALGLSNYTYFSFVTFFRLQDLPDYTEFTTLWDKYCIKGVQLKLIPFSTHSVATQPQSTACLIHSIVDTNDAAGIAASGAGVNVMRERPGYKVANAFNQRKNVCLNRYAKPGCLVPIFSTVGNDYTTKKNNWLVSTSTDVEHYAFKFIIEVYSPNNLIVNTVMFKTEVTYYLEFRDVI